MQPEAAVCDEEQALLPPRSGMGAQGKLVSPLLCASFLLAAGIGGGAIWKSGEKRNWSSGVIGLSGVVCTNDGDDCRTSKCCAKEGNRCYKKNERWASCNESCTPKKTWVGAHRDGHWVQTNYQVWDCTEISRDAHAVGALAKGDLVNALADAGMKVTVVQEVDIGAATQTAQDEATAAADASAAAIEASEDAATKMDASKEAQDAASKENQDAKATAEDKIQAAKEAQAALVEAKVAAKKAEEAHMAAEVKAKAAQAAADVVAAAHASRSAEAQQKTAHDMWTEAQRAATAAAKANSTAAHAFENATKKAIEAQDAVEKVPESGDPDFAPDPLSADDQKEYDAALKAAKEAAETGAHATSTAGNASKAAFGAFNKSNISASKAKADASDALQAATAASNASARAAKHAEDEKANADASRRV